MSLWPLPGPAGPFIAIRCIGDQLGEPFLQLYGGQARLAGLSLAEVGLHASFNPGARGPSLFWNYKIYKVTGMQGY